MTSYVEGALIKDERVVHVGHISLWSLWGYIALGMSLLGSDPGKRLIHERCVPKTVMF